MTETISSSAGAASAGVPLASAGYIGHTLRRTRRASAFSRAGRHLGAQHAGARVLAQAFRTRTRARGRAGQHQAGLMLALRWNMLSGSYSALIAASLSYLAGP